MRTVLKSYLKRLTNLTGNNRSLMLLRLSADQDLDLNELGFINKVPSFSIIEKLIAGKKSISICPLIDPRNEKVNEISKSLKKIDRRERFIFEERGGRDLYVGWPFVQGKFIDGTSVRCPLLFFPVTLEVKEKEWVLELRKDGQISFNKSFLLAYSHFNQLAISDDFMENTFEDADKDSQVFRTELYQLLKQSSLEMNFNQELFANVLTPFENFKKEDFEKKQKKGELKLHSEAVLGIFPQAGSYLVPDYNHLIEKDTSANLEEFFYKKSHPDSIDDAKGSEVDFVSQVKEEQTFTPFKLDASQENAIKAVKKGRSLVVQGPPGTGKSQLISNLIADFIARGKNVLLVCQKRAALDVVYDRLKEKGLDDFLGLVHDFKNDRNAIFDQIKNQIEKLDEYKYRNSSLDAINLERSFVQVSRRIDQISEELEEFKKTLFDESEFGASVKDLYLTSNPALPTIDVKQEFKFFKVEEMENFSKLLKLYLPYASKLDRSDYTWKDRVSFKNFSVSDKKKLLAILDHIPFYQTEVSESIREILGVSLDMEDFQWILDRREQILQVIHLLDDPKTYSNFIHLVNKNVDQDWLIIKERQITECYKGNGIETSLSKDQLGYFQKALEKARGARTSLFKWIWWQAFSKDKYIVKRVFVSNNLKWDRKGFDLLTEMVDNRMNLEHNYTELQECGWLSDIPEEKEYDVFVDWIHYQQTAVGTKTIFKDLRSLKDYLNIPALSYSELKEKLNSLLKILTEVPGEKKKWLEYFTPRQISKILERFDYALDLKDVLNKDYESLVEFDKMKDGLKEHERAVIEKIMKKAFDANLNDIKIIELFQNSVQLEWIESIEVKYPILRAVSSLKMEQMEVELQESIEEKLRLSKEIVLMRSRENAYKNVEFNRLDNRVTYRDLLHQVTKKKKIWPLRKLISEFNQELFQLVPCWMASPESVSAMFPMETIFDLVIFDEASQCFTEKGIPSIYRGRNIVITGDSKQLSPSDLYQVRYDDTEEEHADLEMDSLLELGKKYLTEVKLTGHYRSKSLELIEFSNKYFYNGRLQVLPDFNDALNKHLAIEYIKVKGTWDNNTNLVEAEAVVKQVAKLLNDSPGKSIGIVTFNYKQQNLIQDLLEQNLKAIPDSLIVKNIENVQGDEKDIIIFSIGYAPDAKGKMAMMFGSLNSEGGENRLNVAITRSKEKIYVITSILPNQLKVDDIKHDGPRLLKKYLEYSLNITEGNFNPRPQLTDVYSSSNYLKKDLVSNIIDPSLSLAEELPYADLTVKCNGVYCGLLQTDDDLYYQTKSVKAIHGYLPLAMKDRNWKYKKVFSRNYWENKQNVQEELVKFFVKHD